MAYQLALQYELETTQWLTSEELQRRQMRQLKVVLQHAYQHVPYYRELFDSHNINIPDTLTADFFATLPILKREMIQDAGDRLKSEFLPPHHGKPHEITTSGSTGRPVHLQGTHLTRLVWNALHLRDHDWHQRDFSQKMCVIRWAAKHIAQPPAGRQAGSWGSVDKLFVTGPASMLNVVTPLSQQVGWLLNEQPYYLLSFPSNLAALADYCLEHQVKLDSLGEIRTVGEMLTDQQRSLFKQAWPVKVVDMYSCEEAGYLALQCPAYEHYHVQSESVLIEIVDEHDAPCLPHQPGRVLISSLLNFATPLIRYDLGDLAEFGEPCPCSRSLPVLSKIHGRKRNRLIMPDGRSEFPYLGEHGEIKATTGVAIHQLQVIQHDTSRVEIRLVAEREFTDEESSKVVQLMQKTLGHPFQINITLWQDIPKGPTGKYEEFVSHIAS
jgi:phenylacetate-CoA ligase